MQTKQILRYRLKTKANEQTCFHATWKIASNILCVKEPVNQDFENTVQNKNNGLWSVPEKLLSKERIWILVDIEGVVHLDQNNHQGCLLKKIRS